MAWLQVGAQVPAEQQTQGLPTFSGVVEICRERAPAAGRQSPGGPSGEEKGAAGGAAQCRIPQRGLRCLLLSLGRRTNLSHLGHPVNRGVMWRGCHPTAGLSTGKEKAFWTWSRKALQEVVLQEKPGCRMDARGRAWFYFLSMHRER